MKGKIGHTAVSAIKASLIDPMSQRKKTVFLQILTDQSIHDQIIKIRLENESKRIIFFKLSTRPRMSMRLQLANTNVIKRNISITG